VVTNPTVTCSERTPSPPQDNVSITDQHTGANYRPCVVLIAPPQSYRLAPYIVAAAKLGIELLLVSEGKHSLVSAVANGVHVSFSDRESVESLVLLAIDQRTVHAVIGTDDATVEIASRIAHTLGIAHNDPAVTRLTRRKDLGRAALLKHGLPIPEHRVLPLEQVLQEDSIDIAFPSVIKPLALSGSRGIIRVNNADELVTACRRIERILRLESWLEPYERTHVLVESYIPGQEVALEGLLRGGTLKVLALFDKPDLLEGPFFEETYYVSPSRHDLECRANITETVQLACAVYGLREGPVHAELRIANGRVWILEIAGRTIGGDCARLLSYGTRQTLEETVLSHALGWPVVPDAPEEGLGVLMIPIPKAGILRRVEGILNARQVPYIEEIAIHIREGNELVPLPEGASYLGFIFARAPDAKRAEEALRAAHDCLNIVIAPLFKVAVEQLVEDT